MNIKTIFLLVAASMVFTAGCMPSYYPGIRGAHLPPLLSSNNKDGNLTRYISVDGGIAGDFNSNEKNTISRIRLTWAGSNKFIDTNCGVSLYRGIYSISEFRDYYGDYEYIGISPELYNALYLTEGKFNLGLGTYVSIAYEGGEFLKFRRDSHNAGYADNDKNSISASFSVYPLIRYNFNDKTHLSFQCGCGTPGGFSPTILFQEKTFFLWGYWIPVEKDRSGENINFSFGVGTRI